MEKQRIRMSKLLIALIISCLLITASADHSDAGSKEKESEDHKGSKGKEKESDDEKGSKGKDKESDDDKGSKGKDKESDDDKGSKKKDKDEDDDYPKSHKQKSDSKGTDSSHPTPPQDPSGSRGGLADGGGDFAKQFLDFHNNAREHRGLPPLTWDVKLEAYAKNYAKQRALSDCELIHSKGPYGENLFWGGGPNWGPRDAVKGWLDEYKDYDANSNKCKDGKMCGHFTQMIWKDTERVGCAIEKCKKELNTFISCNYDPPGNYVGEKPSENHHHPQH